MTQHSRISTTPGGVVVVGVPAAGPPERPQELIEALRGIGDGGEFTLSFEGWNAQRAKVGWFRAGYLAAFAALGYRYILQAALAPVRQQIAQPDVDVIPQLIFWDVREPRTSRNVLLVEPLSPVAGVAVQMGKTLVLLPPIDATTGWIDEAAAHVAVHFSEARVTLSGKVVPWPPATSFLLDLGP